MQNALEDSNMPVKENPNCRLPHPKSNTNCASNSRTPSEHVAPSVYNLERKTGRENEDAIDDISDHTISSELFRIRERREAEYFKSSVATMTSCRTDSCSRAKSSIKSSNASNTCYNSCPRCELVTVVSRRRLIGRTSGLRINCSLCRFDWCFVCQAQWHHGVSCDEYQDYLESVKLTSQNQDSDLRETVKLSDNLYKEIEKSLEPTTSRYAKECSENLMINDNECDVDPGAFRKVPNSVFVTRTPAGMPILAAEDSRDHVSAMGNEFTSREILAPNNEYHIDTEGWKEKEGPKCVYEETVTIGRATSSPSHTEEYNVDNVLPQVKEFSSSTSSYASSSDQARNRSFKHNGNLITPNLNVTYSKRNTAKAHITINMEQTCEICLGNAGIFVRQRCCQISLCTLCLQIYLILQIISGKVKITCPNIGCNHLISEPDISILVSRETLLKYKRIVVNEARNPCRKTCPRCSYNTDIDATLGSLEELRISCPECELCWCFNCQVPWHRNITCSEFRSGDDEALKKWASDDSSGQINAQKCPTCQIYIQKNGGCDHMCCTRCGTHFCYQCGQRGSRVHNHITGRNDTGRNDIRVGDNNPDRVEQRGMYYRRRSLRNRIKRLVANICWYFCILCLAYGWIPLSICSIIVIALLPKSNSTHPAS